jgi:hypothetical protein
VTVTVAAPQGSADLCDADDHLISKTSTLCIHMQSIKADASDMTLGFQQALRNASAPTGNASLRHFAAAALKIFRATIGSTGHCTAFRYDVAFTWKSRVFHKSPLLSLHWPLHWPHYTAKPTTTCTAVNSTHTNQSEAA